MLTRTRKKIEKQAGKLKRKVRNRTRSIGKRVIAIATASRHKGEEGEAQRKKQYKELLRYSRQVLNDTKRVIAEVEQMPAKKKQGLRGMCEHLSVMAGRVRQVVKQTKVRIFDGITQLPGKIVSLFEPHTEIIRKGKASKPTEFGKMIQVQETENQIITHYDVFDRRPSDRDLLLGAVEAHQRVLGRVPHRRQRTRDIIRVRKSKPSRKRARSGWRCRIAIRKVSNGKRKNTAAGSRKRKPDARAARAASAY